MALAAALLPVAAALAVLVAEAWAEMTLWALPWVALESGVEHWAWALSSSSSQLPILLASPLPYCLPRRFLALVALTAGSLYCFVCCLGG